MMDGVERWHRVWALVDDALDREPTLRAAYLEQACAGDPTLRRDVERALALGDEPHFLDSGALRLASSLLPGIPKRVQTEWGAVYAIERELGRGGTATVYLAHDLKHNRHIAVKVLHAPLSAMYGAERFVREIRLTAQLQHPHILGLLDSGVFGPETGPLAARPFYTMPYVEGETLRQRLARGPVPAAEAVAILRDVALALAYAHERGVVHRDIKPENVLLSSGSAVVSDFGIAKALQLSVAGEPGVLAANPGESSAFGTVAYMAPEQATADPDMDARADVYSWGIMAYEVLAGRHPFAEWTDHAELLAAHRAEAPEPLVMTAPTVPAALGDLVMRCLAKAPSDRPASGAKILAELGATNIESPSGGSTRRRLGWMIAASILLILAPLAPRAHLKSAAAGEQRPSRVESSVPPSPKLVAEGTIAGPTKALAERPANETDAQSRAAPNTAYTLWAQSFDLGLFADAEHWCLDAHLQYPNDSRFVRCQLFDMLAPNADVTPAAAWALVDTLKRLAPHAKNDVAFRAERMLVAVALARAGLRDSAEAVIAASRSGADGLLGYEAVVRLQLGEREKALSLLADYVRRYPEEGLRLARRKTWMWRDLEDDPRFRALISAK